MPPVPRPKGVAVAAVAWAAAAVFFGLPTFRAYVAGNGLPAFSATVALVTAAIAILLARGSSWGWGLQLFVLVPVLLVFPFTFIAVMLLGYMTRPETVSYFKGRTDGPRWDSSRAWSKGEWPWLVGLGAATALFAFFWAVMSALLRTHPNL